MSRFEAMGEKERHRGDTLGFDRNWQRRREAWYNHWTPGVPGNQVQLAFRMHWEVFNQLIGPQAVAGARVLEVGCGRGSMSSYFADQGSDVTMLDYSDSALRIAQGIFHENGHQAGYVCGDANRLPFPPESFDIVFSIGLLEHFEAVRRPMEEQWRVLRPGGWFLGYVVPEQPDNIQRYFNWVNGLLGYIARLGASKRKAGPNKQEIYRSDSDSRYYIKALEGLDYQQLTVFGMYSIPMISHSPEFPFSLLPAPLEWLLTRLFSGIIRVRRWVTGRHGWICSESMGQAFLIAFRKPESR